MADVYAVMFCVVECTECHLCLFTGSDRDVPMVNSSLVYSVASWPVTNINSATAAAWTHYP